MSSVSHLIAACGRLRSAWNDLRTALRPGNQRRSTQATTDAQQKARNQRATQERTDRPHLSNAGKIVGGGQPPVNLTALDACTRIIDLVEDVAGEMTLRISTIGRNARAYRPDRTDTNSRFLSAVDWVSANAQALTDPPIIDTACRTLDAATQIARIVLGEGPDRRRLASECLSCGRRSLYWDTSSPDHREWHVACDNTACRCRGRDCACKMPERQPGATHVWLESSWNGLADQLKERPHE